MKNNAVLQGRINRRLPLWGVALVVGVALVFAGFAESAAAARVVGKDGKLYACYRVKGKPKGAVRLVAKKARCKRGERKVQWQRAGAPGAQGVAGQTGSTGATGAAGESAQVAALTERVEVLESTLQGVSNETLTKGLATVSGITNAQLLGAVGAVADVNALCTQATSLTTQVNSLTSALDDTALDGVIPLGLQLLVPGLPASLPAFSCP